MKIICLIVLLASAVAVAEPSGPSHWESDYYQNYVEKTDVSVFGPLAEEAPALTIDSSSKKPRCTESFKKKTRFMVCTNKY